MLAIIRSKIFFLPVSYQEPKYYNTQNCNFASYAVWVRNLVSHFEGGTYTEGF